MKSIDLVREFHERFGQCVHDEPYIVDDALNDLRCDLIAEELRELETALADRDHVATLDALTDLQYVLDGAYLSLGFHRYKEAALAEVHRSNMTKLGPDGKPVLRSDGKIIKPAGYSPPDLASVLDPPSPFHVNAPSSTPPTEFASAEGGAPITHGPHALADFDVSDVEDPR